MQVINAIVPTPEQMTEFFAAAEDGPFTMINLLKFKPKAEYADIPQRNCPWKEKRYLQIEYNE